MTPARRKQIRQLLWLYFWLLIFEGALRKWFLPSLANPLLLVRDPIALVALGLGWPLLIKQPWRAWTQSVLLIGVIAFLLAVTVGHGDFPTAFFGARVMVLQFPLIFLYGAVFDRKDVIRFAWTLLVICIPMAILIAMQSNLPDTNILNVGVGGQGTSTYDGAMGRSRPPGTFSFISGVASFFPLAAAALFVQLYNNVRLTNFLRIFCCIAGIALVVALPVSISRTLLFGYLMVLAAVIAALAISRTRMSSLFSGLFAVALAVGLATTVPAFQDTSAAFMARWAKAAEAGDRGVVRSEVGDIGVAASQFQTRVLPGFLAPFDQMDRTPLLGYGVGMGSNLGASRIFGVIGFLVGEGAWENHIGELGPILGLAMIFWRIALAGWILRLSIAASARGNRVPLILAGASFYAVLIGQIAQPTGLGFVVLSAGLTLAALNAGPTPAFR
ncbi:MAG: hypothetical protein ACK6BG_09155 [Cyanobacteriota bacterium]|jgi:hypothetical protein